MFTALRHAARSWKTAKAVALLAAIALAMGIGCTTAIYTVVNAVLLKPLAYTRGERYISLFGSSTDEPNSWSGTSWLNLLEYQKRTRTFDVFGIYQPREFSLTAPGEPRHLSAVEVSPSLAVNLGVNPVLGRWFQEDAGLYLAVISHDLWKTLGGNTAVLGQTLTLDGRVYTVTGVMPQAFRLPASGTSGEEIRADLWVPLNPLGASRDRANASYFAYARVKSGVTTAQADADVKRVAAQLAAEYPNLFHRYTAKAVNLRESIVKEIRPTLLMLFVAAAVLLLITCANVAGLLLARSVARSRETAIRVALGARQSQLAVQYFFEGLLVSLVAAAIGIGISYALVRFVLAIAADYIPRADDISVNREALLFAVAAAILASVLFSLAPLWQARRTLPNEVLSDGARASATSHSRSLSRALVVSEIALAFALLSLSALLLAHLSGLLRIGPGFDPEHLVTFSLSVSDVEYPGLKNLAPYQRRIEQALQAVPGIAAASFVNMLPMNGCCFQTGFTPPGDTERVQINLTVASSSYLRAMHIPLLKGRFFDDATENPESKTAVVVVDQAAVRRYWHGRDPVGSTLAGADRIPVVGVVGDVRIKALSDTPEPTLYLSAFEVPVNPVHFVVRSTLPLGALIPQVRRAIAGVSRTQPIYNVEAMPAVLQGSVVTERLQSFLTGFFASAALLMAALGVYGVVAYSVRNRTVEIGTRMALGATGRDVLSLVVGDGFRMAAWGVGLGGLVVIATALVLRSQIFGIQVNDPRPFLFSTAAVAGFTAIACFFPAWRASRLSPMVAIRDTPGSTRNLTIAPEPAADLDEGTLLAEFVDASRQAETFQHAIDLSLELLRKVLKAESIALAQPDALLTARLSAWPFALPLSEQDLSSWSRWAAENKPEHLAEIEHLRDQGVRLIVPLLAKNKIAGVLLLGAPTGRARYSTAEKRALRSCAGQFALLIENERLTNRMLEQEKLRRDVQLATEVQKRLFPDAPPANGLVSLAGMSIPARGVGGDYYDFLDLGDNRIGIALADVAGKGVAAALIMSVVQASLRILAVEEGITLSKLAEKMNHYLHRSTRSSGYATFFYAEIDERKRQLRYVNAGHNPPYLMRFSTIEELPAGGTVIGLFPKNDYEEAVIDLNPGDVLIAFTDGVPEALNPDEEEYGEDRLKLLLQECAALSVDEISTRIAAELKAWIAEAPQYDDLTFIILRVASTKLETDV